MQKYATLPQKLLTVYFGDGRCVVHGCQFGGVLGTLEELGVLEHLSGSSVGGGVAKHALRPDNPPVRQ